jgi:hypothetical protein
MAIIKKEFNTIEEAQTFIDAINLQLGIPNSENSVAQSYTDCVEEDGKFYVEYDNEIIIFDESIEAILGETTEIKIITQN